MSRSSSPEPVTAVTDLASAWLPARMVEVERRLAETVRGWGPELAGDAGETLSAGGKRMRPLLVLLCAGQRSGPEAIRAAIAIELVHMATLVHDDVLDAAPLRRGLPTVVANAGRRRAVAAGDLLFSRAFAILAADGEDSAADPRPRRRSGPTARSSCSRTPPSRSPAASSPSAATPTTPASRSSATGSAAS